jgi:predicted transposase/invertase (TIGR01784 family)
MKNGKLETAKRMLNRGVSIEDIMLYTGLTEKEVRSLLN